MNAQSRLLEQNLRQLQIPYRLIGGKSFFDRREVKDLLAYASCLLNTDDDVSLLRIINTPARGISPATVEAATAYSARSQVQRLSARSARPSFSRRSPRARAAPSSGFQELLDRYETKLNRAAVRPVAVLRELIGRESATWKICAARARRRRRRSAARITRRGDDEVLRGIPGPLQRRAARFSR